MIQGIKKTSIFARAKLQRVEDFVENFVNSLIYITHCELIKVSVQ